MSIQRRGYSSATRGLYKAYAKDGELLGEGEYSIQGDYTRPDHDIVLKFPVGTVFKLLEIESGDTEEFTRIVDFAHDLPKYHLPRTNNALHRSWCDVERFLVDQAEYHGVLIDEILNPQLQRGRVWTEEQQVAYIEHVCRGGESGKEVWFNQTGWNSTDRLICVDGLQRITAVRRFYNNEFKVFNKYYGRDFGEIWPLAMSFVVHTIDFKTDAEIKAWYMRCNDGGTQHTQEELDRVRNLEEIY